MDLDEPKPNTGAGGRAWFATTHWSVVLAAAKTSAPGAQEALEALCRAYWPPIFTYVRRRGHPLEEAQDLVQEFFARFLQKKYFAQADPTRGRFRNFLLTAIQHFLVGEWQKSASLKRGGGQFLISWEELRMEPEAETEPADFETPESAYERQWAVTLLEHACQLLGEEYAAAGKQPLFDHLKGFVWGGRSELPYAQVGEQLGMSEGAVKVAVHRLRQRYGQLLRQEVAQTVAHPEEVDEELRYLVSVMSG
ncbi:MAG: sigma-70 family RNA polymerase sigma factor [Verrucomicrobia bacterium]|nr:sigma-70 family RNA polymerase sigma factor [Verrucomicrobiota bacterium]